MVPHVTPRRMMGCGDLLTVEAALDYGDWGPLGLVGPGALRGQRILGWDELTEVLV
jgi:hypothetical protein